MTYSNFLQQVNSTPQNQPAHAAQVPNNAGGYSFALDDWKQLDRFLILGTQGGTYYLSEFDLTKQNYDAVLRCIAADGIRVVNRVVEVSDKGLAAKNDPAIFVLALCCAAKYASLEVRVYAAANLRKVCRIGTHLFHFASFVTANRKWGRLLRTAIANWYHDRTPKDLVNQFLKYQQRDGWSHADLIKLSHVKPKTPDESAAFALAVDHKDKAKHADTEVYRRWIDIRGAHEHDLPTADLIAKIRTLGLQREMLPTEALGDVAVWDALLPDLGLTAVIRNLGVMTSVGLLDTQSSATRYVLDLFSDKDAIQRSRLHPLTVLTAFQQYRQGKGDKGNKTWIPVTAILDALDDLFYATFSNVETLGLPLLVAIDVSGSMTIAALGGTNLSCAAAACALAVVIAGTERQAEFMGFDTDVRPYPFSKRMRLDQILDWHLSGGGTDCHAPFRWAIRERKKYDGIVMLTDGETWAGGAHPFQGFAQYRQVVSPQARWINIAMAANAISNQMPGDPAALEVAGFSADLPRVISAFLRGGL